MTTYALVRIDPRNARNHQISILEMVCGGMSQDRAQRALIHWRTNGKNPDDYQIRETDECENCGAPCAPLQGRGDGAAFVCIDRVECDNRLRESDYLDGCSDCGYAFCIGDCTP